jgi:hypothetical protein
MRKRRMLIKAAFTFGFGSAAYASDTIDFPRPSFDEYRSRRPMITTSSLSARSGRQLLYLWSQRRLSNRRPVFTDRRRKSPCRQVKKGEAL